MSNILIVCGAQKTYISDGRFNRSLVEAAQTTLEEQNHAVQTTIIEDGYDPEEEREK